MGLSLLRLLSENELFLLLFFLKCPFYLYFLFALLFNVQVNASFWVGWFLYSLIIVVTFMVLKIINFRLHYCLGSDPIPEEMTVKVEEEEEDQEQKTEEEEFPIGNLDIRQKGWGRLRERVNIIRIRIHKELKGGVVCLLFPNFCS